MVEMLTLLDRKNSKIIPKRYPFTEFKSPYLPDQDQQELPNSKHAMLESVMLEQNADRFRIRCGPRFQRRQHIAVRL